MEDAGLFFKFKREAKMNTLIYDLGMTINIAKRQKGTIKHESIITKNEYRFELFEDSFDSYFCIVYIRTDLKNAIGYFEACTEKELKKKCRLFITDAFYRNANLFKETDAERLKEADINFKIITKS